VPKRKKLYDRLYRAVERMQREGTLDVDLSPEEQKRMRAIRVKEALKKYVVEEDTETEKVNEPMQHETVHEEDTSHVTRIEKPTYTEIEESKEEEPSFIMQYGKAKKMRPQKPKSSLSHVINGLFGESKTTLDVIHGGYLDEKEESVNPNPNSENMNPVTKFIEGWKMLFGLLRGNLEVKKELEEEETI